MGIQIYISRLSTNLKRYHVECFFCRTPHDKEIKVSPSVGDMPASTVLGIKRSPKSLSFCIVACGLNLNANYPMVYSNCEVAALAFNKGQPNLESHVDQFYRHRHLTKTTRNNSPGLRIQLCFGKSIRHVT